MRELLKHYFDENHRKVYEEIIKFEEQNIPTKALVIIVDLKGTNIESHIEDLNKITAYYFVNFLLNTGASFMDLPILIRSKND